MQLILSKRSYERGLNLYLVFVALVLLAYGLLTAKVSRNWVVADWLINYSGGFVRRGLLGEIALLLAHLLHVSPIAVAVVFYLTPYGIFLFAIHSLAVRAVPVWWVVALLLSPATLAFPVLDVTAGFRKEVVYLAGLALMVTWAERRRLSPFAMSAALTLLLTVTVLSHEPLICYFPYLFAALIVSGRTFRQACQQFVVPLAAGLTAAWVCSHHLGNAHIAAAICSSISGSAGGIADWTSQQSNPLCTGAIAFLTYTREQALIETRDFISKFPYYTIYSCTLLLAIVPLVGGGIALARTQMRGALRWVWAMAAMSAVGSIPLFLYAQDWGRWIYVHVVSCGILLLFLEGRRRELAPSIDIDAAKLRPRQRVLIATALAAYAGLWTLPHVPNQTPRFGYPGLASYFLHYRGTHPGSKL